MKDYTVKQIADLLKVSKTTVQKYIKAAAIKYDYVEYNKQFYSYEKAKGIIKGIRENFDFSALDTENQVENSTTKTENQVENSTTKTENSQEKTENSPPKTENSTTEQDTTNRMLDMLQKEIEKKDQEIKDLREKLDKAYDRIADMADKAQYITAADKTALIMDKKQQQEEVEKPAAAGSDQVEATEQPQQKEKVGFFKRLFGRK